MDQNIEKFDLAIVGASLAGNYLCYLLSNTSLKVVVIEEHDFVGKPFQCAGIVSQKLSRLIDLPEEIILNRVKVAKIVAPLGTYIKLSGAEHPYIINRIGLDRLFYDNVKDKENINYLFGERFKSFRYIKENRQIRVLIETSKRKLKTKMLIGCDGPSSLVAKSFGIKNKNIYAIQIRIKANFDDNEAAIFFDSRWREFFGWIVPEGNNIYRIGMACTKDLARNFRIFLKKLKIDFHQKIDQQGGLIPIGMMNKLSFNNVLLVGDSAGQVKATTGGGIIMLLTAAKHASRCIQKCFELNKFSKKFIKKYYELPCKSSIGKELRIHYLIRLILKKFRNNDFIKLFQIIKISKIENFITIYGDMDFPRALILKIIKNPLVITFLIKYLLRNPEILVKLVRIIPK